MRVWFVTLNNVKCYTQTVYVIPVTSSQALITLLEKEIPLEARSSAQEIRDVAVNQSIEPNSSSYQFRSRWQQQALILLIPPGPNSRPDERSFSCIPRWFISRCHMIWKEIVFAGNSILFSSRALHLRNMINIGKTKANSEDTGFSMTDLAILVKIFRDKFKNLF